MHPFSLLLWIVNVAYILTVLSFLSMFVCMSICVGVFVYACLCVCVCVPPPPSELSVCSVRRRMPAADAEGE